MKSNIDLPFPSDEDTVTIPLVFNKTDVFTKKSIIDNANEIMDKLLDDGMTNPLEIYTQLKAVSEYIDACIDKVKPTAIDELEKYGKDGVKMYGVPLIVKNQGKKYSFDHCDMWVQLDDEIKELTEERKNLEAQLKGAIGTQGIIAEDGEVIEPARIVSEGKTIIQATIPNK